MATTWINAILKVHPTVTFIAVGAPAVIGNNARKQSWNADMFKTLRGASAVSMHEYHDSYIGTSTSFTAAQVPIMLGAPFYYWSLISAAAGALPAGISVAMTEFNLKDTTASGIAGTWAHGLYIATEVMLALNDTARFELVDMHCAVADASVGAVFSSTDAFNFALSPDPSLATALFGRSATAWTTGLLTAAAGGQTAVRSLAFKPNPPVPGGATGPYPSLLGAAFTDASGTRATAAVLNIGPTALDLQLAQAGGPYLRFETASADPRAAINDDSKVTLVKAPVPGSGTLSLPAYSVTVLLGA